MRHFGLITVGRSDFSIYESLLKTYNKKRIRFTVIATTAHYQKKFGYTIDQIKKFRDVNICEVNSGIEVKSTLDVAASISEHIKSFSLVIPKLKLDGVLILGDRYEAFSAAISSSINLIPIFHLHGGVITEGSIDDAFRHSISKFSSYHFVDNLKAKERLVQMGEPPNRIFHVGAMSLENIGNTEDLEDKDFYKQVFSSEKKIDFAIATYHPSSKKQTDDSEVLKRLFLALLDYKGSILFTYPNADAKNQEIISYLKDKSKINKNIFLTKNMGSKFYYSALRRADFMIGNSSSGIIESLAFNLPVVNIGTRQQGRDCNINVVHASETLSSIKKGIKKSLSLEFRKSFKGTKDIYLKRDTTRSILNKLEDLEISKSKLVKKFYKL